MATVMCVALQIAGPATTSWINITSFSLEPKGVKSSGFFYALPGAQSILDSTVSLRSGGPYTSLRATVWSTLSLS